MFTQENSTVSGEDSVRGTRIMNHPRAAETQRPRQREEGIREAERPHRVSPRETQGDRKAVSPEREHGGVWGWGSVLALPGPH